MSEHNEHITELIARYFAGEASPEEAIALDEWKALSDENLAYFNACGQAMGVPPVHVDTQALYQRILDALPEEKQEKHKTIRLNNLFSPLRIAAAVLLFASVGLWIYKANNASAPDVQLAATSAPLQQKLVDGSMVMLNKNTTLTLVSGLEGNERRLKLSGEAYFEVKHNDQQPFVIEAGGVLIKDIGTSFNVQAHPQSDTVLVSVTEGIVDMSTGNETLRLTPGEAAVFVKSTHQLKKLNVPPANIDAYKTRMFSFKATSLLEVIAAVNEVYGPVLKLEKSNLETCVITVDFNNESPETMATIIAETLGLSYQKVGEAYILKGEACVQ